MSTWVSMKNPHIKPRNYHVEDIRRGTFGEFDKIEEELAEAKDAKNQGVKVMELVELSDVLLAMDGYLKKHHPGTTMNDLQEMAKVTKRAFDNGHRHGR